MAVWYRAVNCGTMNHLQLPPTYGVYPQLSEPADIVLVTERKDEADSRQVNCIYDSSEIVIVESFRDLLQYYVT